MKRIWWQSFAAVEWAGVYRDHLERHAAEVLDGAAEFHLAGLPASTFGKYPPMSLLGHPYASHLLLRDIPEYAIEAQSQGYSAFVLGSYSEPHLRVVRSAVDITVGSVAESTLLAACTTAQRIGIVVITPALKQIVSDIVARHGLTSRVACIAVMEPTVLEHELVAGFENADSIVERFATATAVCVAAQADAIIPGEGILSEVLYSAGVHISSGVPVVDCFGVTLLHTIFQMQAAERAYLVPGRTWSYPKLDQDKTDFVRSVPPFSRRTSG